MAELNFCKKSVFDISGINAFSPCLGQKFPDYGQKRQKYVLSYLFSFVEPVFIDCVRALISCIYQGYAPTPCAPWAPLQFGKGKAWARNVPNCWRPFAAAGSWSSGRSALRLCWNAGQLYLRPLVMPFPSFFLHAKDHKRFLIVVWRGVEGGMLQ